MAEILLEADHVGLAIHDWTVRRWPLRIYHSQLKRANFFL